MAFSAFVIHCPSGTTASDSFLYDNEGNRVLQRTSDSSGVKDTITFDGYTETVVSGGTTIISKYYSAAEQRLAMRTGSTLSYLLSDSLGSSTIALSSAGSVVAVQLFAPFGSSRYSLGTIPTTYNFTGQRLDSETGLLYYGARYYDPFSARFVQADSVQNNASGMDPYAYVGENPETKTDPSGRYYSNGRPITQQGGAIGYVSGTTITTVTNTGYGSVWTADGSYSTTGGSLSISSYSWQQASLYGGYNPYTDAANSPGAKLSDVIGLPRLQQTWSNPNATWQDKVGAVGQFALTNINNALQLAMIFGGPEDEGVVAAEEEAASAGEEAIAAEEEGSSIASSSEECGALSFTPTTPVSTAHGKQAIGTMKIGEQVWAYNPKTGKMELQRVQHVWINHDNDLVDLTITVLAKHGKTAVRTSETIHTNKKHPFLTKEKGFLPVGQITIGMHVLRANGTYGVVTGWKVVPGTKVMYNLEVAQDHTFTVGAGQWVVHNDLGCGIHSSLPYKRSLLGDTPSTEATNEVLARDPVCVYCGNPSEVADHEPSLQQRWINGEYDNMTRDQIRADADNPERMVGACASCNSSKAGRPLAGDGDGWDYESSPRNMRLLEGF